jgi:hypothetical protein
MRMLLQIFTLFLAEVVAPIFTGAATATVRSRSGSTRLDCTPPNCYSRVGVSCCGEGEDVDPGRVACRTRYWMMHAIAKPKQAERSIEMGVVRLLVGFVAAVQVRRPLARMWPSVPPRQLVRAAATAVLTTLPQACLFRRPPIRDSARVPYVDFSSKQAVPLCTGRRGVGLPRASVDSACCHGKQGN